jgi:hypothetical protein
MGGLLKYAVVLALGIAIGVYVVLEPLTLEDIVPDTAGRDAATAHSEAAQPATPASIEEEQLEYSVAQRLASLDGWRAFLAAHPNGAYAQSARAEVERRLGGKSASTEGAAATPALSPTDNEKGDGPSQRLGALASRAQSAAAKVERLLLAEKAPASGDPEASADASSSETRAATESPSPVLPPPGDAVPATDAAVSHDASQDAKPGDDVPRHLAPPAGADGAAGAQVAALGADAICQRDEERLAQLRMKPSRGEAERFASELGCEKLRPQVVALFASPAPPPAAADASAAAPPDAKSADIAAPPALPVAGADVAALTSDESCKRDEDRLAQLRMNPSSNELVRFANELGCRKLLPQVVNLMKSLAPTPSAADMSTAAPADVKPVDEAERPASPRAGGDVTALTSDESCKRDEDRLLRLRASPSADEALRFENELGCEKLRPQLQRLVESLGSRAPAPAALADRSHLTPSLGEACASERSALDRLRQEPSAEAAGLFWRDMKCEELRPQVRLLLESLNIAPDSVASASEPEARGAASDAPSAIETDPAACQREAAELNRLRATPDLGDAKRFASTVTCGALRPQVARLLESFGE